MLPVGWIPSRGRGFVGHIPSGSSNQTAEQTTQQQQQQQQQGWIPQTNVGLNSYIPLGMPVSGYASLPAFAQTSTTTSGFEISTGGGGPSANNNANNRFLAHHLPQYVALHPSFSSVTSRFAQNPGSLGNTLAPDQTMFWLANNGSSGGMPSTLFHPLQPATSALSYNIDPNKLRPSWMNTTSTGDATTNSVLSNTKKHDKSPPSSPQIKTSIVKPKRNKEMRKKSRKKKPRYDDYSDEDDVELYNSDEKEPKESDGSIKDDEKPVDESTMVHRKMLPDRRKGKTSRYETSTPIEESEESGAAASTSYLDSLNGEQRLLVNFISYGKVPTKPQKMGKKKALIPDGISGSFVMYGETWKFEVNYEVMDVDISPDLALLRWSITNEASETSNSILETPEESERRQSRGISVCNKVFREAMELRAQQYQAQLEEQKKSPEPDYSLLVKLENSIQSLRPARFSEGPLLFGLRHKAPQQYLGVSL